MQLTKLVLRFLVLSSLSFLATMSYADESGSTIAGLYNAILLQEKTNFYQPVQITLRTTSVGGNLKIQQG